MEIVKKLSIGKLVGKVTGFLPDSRTDITPVEMGRVVGIARGIKTGESTFGPWRALTGDFVFIPSVGAKKDQKFRSGQLFMPDVALDLVAPIVENIERGNGVEVAFSLSARNDADSSVGYVYTCAFLMEPADNDPLVGLLTKALPAPAPEKTDDKKTDAEKPADKK